MRITNDTVGEILCFPETGKRIKITDVSEQFITYESEAGETYGSKDFSVSAFPETDIDRITRFDANNAIGKALTAAETKALKIIDAGINVPKQDRELAYRALDVVAEQRETIEKRAEMDLYKYPLGRGLAVAFLEDLCQKGEDAKATILGHEVTNLSKGNFVFSIDNVTYNYESTLSVLSELTKKEVVREKEQARKPSLESLINAASRKVNNIPNKDFEKDINPER